MLVYVDGENMERSTWKADQTDVYVKNVLNFLR